MVHLVCVWGKYNFELHKINERKTFNNYVCGPERLPYDVSVDLNIISSCRTLKYKWKCTLVNMINDSTQFRANDRNFCTFNTLRNKTSGGSCSCTIVWTCCSCYNGEYVIEDSRTYKFDGIRYFPKWHWKSYYHWDLIQLFLERLLLHYSAIFLKLLTFKPLTVIPYALISC